MRILYISLISLALISCTEKDRELVIIEQEADIEDYINKEYADKDLVRNNGSNRIILDKGISTTDSLEFGDSLSFYYTGFVFNSGRGAVFATNYKEMADSLDFILSDPNYELIQIIFKEDVYINGLTNGLLGVREDEHSIILFSAKYGFNNESVNIIPNLSALLYEVWIEKITKNN